ncbi:MAG: hypothetical protein AW07_01550 [Candidatus Accumulibacter sp. SK-11]|nr:MAG: hypothetical protein AW07_01550 [Candidatus Accumulibacter sp. SK-11]
MRRGTEDSLDTAVVQAPEFSGRRITHVAGGRLRRFTILDVLMRSPTRQALHFVRGVCRRRLASGHVKRPVLPCTGAGPLATASPVSLAGGGGRQ